MSRSVSAGRNVLGIGARIAVAVLVLSSGPASAASIRNGPAVLVAASETISDDLYASGRTIQVAGTIDGDLIVAGSDVSVSGRVNGDVLATGGSVTISGPVAGTIRAAGGQITVQSRVERDLVLAGGRIDVGPTTRVGRDALFGAGETHVAGQIGRNVRAGTGRLTLAQSAVIHGDLVLSSGKPLERAPGATVGGRIIQIATRRGPPPTPGARAVAAFVGWIKGLIGLFAFGLLVVLLAPGLTRRAIQSLAGAPWESLGWGVAVFVFVPMVAAFVSIVGIFIGGWWIGVVLLALWLVALPVGYVMGSLRTGEWLARRMGRASMGLILSLLVGLVGVGLLGAIPFLGWIVSLAACLVGIGATAVALRAARELGRNAATPVFGRTPEAPAPG